MHPRYGIKRRGGIIYAGLLHIYHGGTYFPVSDTEYGQRSYALNIYLTGDHWSRGTPV